MNIYLGNLSIDDIEKRTGITLTDEHKKYMNEHHQMEVYSTPIKKGFWHGFDMPFMILTGDESTAKEYADMFSAYDWSNCKESLQIGYERNECRRLQSLVQESLSNTSKNR